MTWFPKLLRVLHRAWLFCLGPTGGTALLAIMTGALFARLEWMGLVIAGVISLLVLARMNQEEDGPPALYGPANLTGYLRILEARRCESQVERAARHNAERQRREALSLAHTASTAMIVAGLAMFSLQTF